MLVQTAVHGGGEHRGPVFENREIRSMVAEHSA
jgi:hypothetical protein